MDRRRRRRRHRRHHRLRRRQARRRRLRRPARASARASPPAQVVGEIESTKSVGELFAPVDGEVVEVNEAVVDDPTLVNTDPFGDGWLDQGALRPTLPDAARPRRVRAAHGRRGRDRATDRLRRPPHRHGCRRPARDARRARLRQRRRARRGGGARHRIHVAPTLDELDIPPAATEREALAELRALAVAEHASHRSMIGLGYYDTITPSVIQRNVLENPSWYTAYTPYQPEISQGRLEALINFQTMVTDLTGLATANASMLDEAHRGRRGDAAGPPRVRSRRRTCSSSTPTRCRRPRRCCEHRAEAVGIELRRARPRARRRRSPTADVLRRRSCSTRAPPAASGTRPASSPRCKAQGGLAVVAADLLALTLLTSPG